MKLHIGGKQPHPDWKILDVEPRPEVDFVCDAADLSQFPDESISAIYASHVLEHFYYGLNYELSLVLMEWFRVLAPTGQLMISVPNLQTLCWLYCDLQNTKEEKGWLCGRGFANMQPVNELHLFQDCSALRWKGQLISLNGIINK